MHKEYCPYFEVSMHQVFSSDYLRRFITYFQKMPELGFQLGATAPEVDSLPMYYLASLLPSFLSQSYAEKINKGTCRHTVFGKHLVGTYKFFC